MNDNIHWYPQFGEAILLFVLIIFQQAFTILSSYYTEIQNYSI